MDALPTPPQAHGRILVADDEPHIRRVLATLLTTAGFEVREVVDGREAIQIVSSGESLDLLLLDLMMPRASGLDVLAWVRGSPEHARLPVIILTAKGQDADREAALLAGANDFLTKPFSPKKLISRIQEILAGR